MKKVSIIGAGNVGATAAFFLAQKDCADIVLIDVVEGLSTGKALDAMEAAPLDAFHSDIIGTNDMAAIAGSDIVVITAGIARKPGMSREDLLGVNANIIKSVCEEIAQRAPEAIIIVVTNPLDVMTYLAQKVSGFAPNKVIGQAGVLDSARLRYFVAEELGVSVHDVQAMVLGSHGDSMVPLPRYTTVSGIPITELLPADTIARLMQRTRDGGAEIVKHLKTGSAFYAPAAATIQMVEAILKDTKSLLPVSAYLNGEYGEHNIYIGVPVILGAKGIEKILELNLSAEEKAAFQKSVAIFKQNIRELKI